MRRDCDGDRGAGPAAGKNDAGGGGGKRAGRGGRGGAEGGRGAAGGIRGKKGRRGRWKQARGQVRGRTKRESGETGEGRRRPGKGAAGEADRKGEEEQGRACPGPAAAGESEGPARQNSAGRGLHGMRPERSRGKRDGRTAYLSSARNRPRFFSSISRQARAAGVTPEMRPACPRVRGRMALSFS